jgi:hypothetical protein
VCRTDRLALIEHSKLTMTTFRALEKAILTKEQLAAFQSSNTYAKITSYIDVLNSAVVGCKLTDECTQSQVRRIALALHFAVSPGRLLTGQVLCDC